jgi:hypothetical protein
MPSRIPPRTGRRDRPWVHIPTEFIVDAIDILIVTLLLYRPLLAHARDAAPVHMFFGLIILFVLSVIAQWCT